LKGDNVSKKKDQVLITGGCGFIGSNLVVRLLEEGYQIKVLDNLSVGKRDNIPSDIDLIVGDVRDEDVVPEAVAGMNAVVHLAAHTNVVESIEQPQLDFDINVRGTFNLLQRCVESNVGKFVFASSNAVVGEQSSSITESVAPAPLSPYGASKLSSEALCSAFWGSYGLQTIALRFANVYGPRSNHKESVVAKFLKSALNNQTITIYGDGSQTRDLVYVDDICQAILLAIEADSVTGVFQIGTGIETRIIDLAKQIKQSVNSDSDIVFEQPRKGDIVRDYSCIEKAKRILGFEPETDLNTGLAKAYDWFKNRNE
jgi:UDP-glucose 4-epimerase